MKPGFRVLAKRVALATLFVYGATCGAQDATPLARPEVKLDDRWIYRRMDHRFEPPVLLYELRVSFVDGRAIHTVLARQGRPRDSDATWTPEWNNVVSVDEGIVDLKGGGLLQFPLSPGRTYASMWEMRRPRAGKFHVRHERTVKIVGWEDIEVPAGKFQALKVEAEGRWRRLDSKQAGWARNTVWYAPQVKRWVKSVYEDAQGKIGEELVFFVVE